MSGDYGRFDCRSVKSGRIIKRCFLAYDHAATDESLQKCAIFQVFEQMRFAAAEIAADQHSANLLIGCQVIGNLTQLVDEEPFDRSLIAAHYAYCVTIGY